MGNFQSNVAETIDFGRWRSRVRDDTFSRYHFEMGRALLEHENDVKAGVDQLRRAVAVDPTLLVAQCVLVDALQGAGLEGEAEAAHRAAVAVAPDYRLLGLCSLALEKIGAGDHVAARALIDRAEKTASGRSEITACRLALQLADEEAVDLAAAVGLAVGQIAPDLAGVLSNLGRRLTIACKLSVAELACRWSLHLDPGNTDACLGMIDLLRRRSAYRELIGVIESGLAVAPWNATLHFSLGNACMVDDDDWTRAQASFNAALKYDPGLTIARQYGDYIRIARGEPAEVAAEIMATLTNRPAEDKRWLLLALHVAGDIPGALSVAHALDKAGRRPIDDDLMALELAAQGRIDEGVAVLEAGRPGRPPDNVRSRMVWAYLIARKGDTVRGLAEIEATVPDLPFNAFELACWAVLRDVAGERDAADGLYRRAFAASPKLAWLNARLLPEDGPRIAAAYRRLGLTPHRLWPEAPSTVGGATQPK